MNIPPWLDFILDLGGALVGAYLAVRITLARMEERIKAQGARLDGHEKRIERLEDQHFRAD